MIHDHDVVVEGFGIEPMVPFHQALVNGSGN